MIIEWMAEFFGVGLSWLVSFIPSGTLDLPSFGPLVGLMKVFDTILPVTEAFAGIAAIMTARAVIFSVDIIKLIWTNLPFKAT